MQCVHTNDNSRQPPAQLQPQSQTACAVLLMQGGMDLSPHLYVLPLELTPFLEVLSALGAQEAFSAAQYTTVLQVRVCGSWRLFLSTEQNTAHDSFATNAAHAAVLLLCLLFHAQQDLADEAGGKPLQPKQLAQALGVAQALADVLGASGGGATAGKKAVSGSMAAAEGSLSGITSSSSSGKPPSSDVVLVPDEDGVMRPAADLAFDDAPWLDDGPSQGGPRMGSAQTALLIACDVVGCPCTCPRLVVRLERLEPAPCVFPSVATTRKVCCFGCRYFLMCSSAALHPGVDGELKLVHSRIAAPVAEALGVASRRRLLLAASADCFALGLAGAGGAVEAFGQSEALTTRLRHIIQVRIDWVCGLCACAEACPFVGICSVAVSDHTTYAPALAPACYPALLTTAAPAYHSCICLPGLSGGPRGVAGAGAERR